MVATTGVLYCCNTTWGVCGTSAALANDSITPDMIHSAGQVNGDVLVWTTGDVLDWQPRITANPSLTKSVAVSSPTNSEKVVFWRTGAACTITRLDCVRQGGSALTYTIKHGSSIASGTEVVTNGTSCTSTTTGTANAGLSVAVGAGEFVWFETSVSTGSPTGVSVVVRYTEP
jgi:hypothetical protein